MSIIFDNSVCKKNVGYGLKKKRLLEVRSKKKILKIIKNICGCLFDLYKPKSIIWLTTKIIYSIEHL